MEPTLLPPRESLLGEPRKTASLLFMSIGAQAQFSFDIRGAGSRSLEEKVGIAGSPNSLSRVSSRISLEQSQSAVASAVSSAAYTGSAVASAGCFRQTCTDASSSSNEG